MIERPVLAYLAQHPQWPWRQRLLDPLTTTRLFTTQVLHGNTAINHLRHLAGMNFSDTAYCNAPRRLPLALLQAVSDSVTRQLLPALDDACRWRGHRVWLADASSFSMPDTPELQEQYGQPAGQAPGCGFPTATLLTLCNAAGFIVQTWDLPLHTHEASQITKHAIFRMQQKQTVSFRPGRKHAGACPKAQRRGQPKSQWLSATGQARSTGALVQTQAEAQVDEPGAL
ncbi:MAG: hypothetical protein WD042_18300 [Phycisphaeraceae bacterium]